MFETITYDKGGAVLKMLNFTLTKPNFLKGLQNYLHMYQYSNAKHNNLWQALTMYGTNGVSDWNNQPLNVTTFLNPWVEQMGFPLVSFIHYLDLCTFTSTYLR